MPLMSINWSGVWPLPVHGPRPGVKLFDGVPIYHDFAWEQHFPIVAPRRFRGQIKAAELCDATRRTRGACDFLLLTTSATCEPEGRLLVIQGGPSTLTGAVANLQWLRRRTNRRQYFEQYLLANDENIQALKKLPPDKLKKAAITLLHELSEIDDFDDQEFRGLTDLYLRMAEGRLTVSMVDSIINALDEESEDVMAQKLIEEHPERALSYVENDQTERDVVAIAYRRAQVEKFDRMLRERAYFDELKFALRLARDEDVWQAFFQNNQWILGYGLSYHFLAGVDDKLEQTTRGRTLQNVGKRVDALMKTVGELRSLCFIEIKTHETPLIVKNQPRVGVGQISSELSAAIAQIQATVATAERDGNDIFRPKNEDGVALDEIFQYQPRSMLVIGRLSEFLAEGKPAEWKFRTFEIFRRNIIAPEIITFDELYFRARSIARFDDDDPIL